jgi:uncharacterized membrane protein YtjA (UPF0391 family)
VQGRFEKRLPGEVAFEKEKSMLNWALTFLLVALLAALFGFTGIALATAGVAKILFFLFLVLFIASLIAHVARRA